jgi:hypothetical protein
MNVTVVNIEALRGEPKDDRVDVSDVNGAASVSRHEVQHSGSILVDAVNVGLSLRENEQDSQVTM